MSEGSLLFLDIQPKSSTSTTTDSSAVKPLWTRSDNDFRFNFFSECSAPHVKEAPNNRTTSPTNHISFTGQDSSFAFNFQIPPAAPGEDMETTEKLKDSYLNKQEGVHVEKIGTNHEANNPPESSAHSKTKKKRKSGRRNASSSTSSHQSPAAESEGLKELSGEEQLNRQLDWCIEQLEVGLMSQKGTAKQKEEASRALKTLRSSKAPLVKKRQVMRAMAGDYRKKMEEEKNKQFKLIQTELSSAKVKAVSESPKKSVFHRKAEIKSQTEAGQQNQMKTRAEDGELLSQTEEETQQFVFIPSKEEFHFNFLS